MELEVKCRICKHLETKDKLSQACKCDYSRALVHKICLKEKIESDGSIICEYCKQEFKGIEVKKRKKSIFSWIYEEPVAKGLVIGGFVLFSSLFYLIFIGFLNFGTSANLISLPWRLLMLSFATFYGIVVVIILVAYLTQIWFMYLNWRETHCEIKV
ncbi:hypothetical protein B4U79_18482 [Dinothrombium tinctorium]|uniref:RING-CH-type domain-containing protein n=1 Tax=Dinothrombium tinctorium TaxID=1965070 RepID=A0A443QHE7_9ACAR|nr:hypothetical protein B4U79_18482 [Dinothrombium tinctorium]